MGVPTSAVRGHWTQILADAITYLLNDQFTTDLAAGIVNATAPEPGPGGNRVVTDGNSVLSISGALLSFATGGVGANNPRLSYSSIARAAGLLLIATVNETANGLDFGWSTTAANGITNGIRLAGTALRTPTVIDIGVVSTGINYSVCSILRATGAFVLIKGGSFTNWTLVWIEPTINTTPMFPGIRATSTTAVFTADNIRVPVPVYIPSPLAYDTFTRADGAIGSTETTGPDSQVLVALAWTGATYTISTNKVINTPTLGADVIVNGGFGADTDWSKGAGWTIAAGTAVATAASSDITATVAPLTLGVWYQTAFTQGGFGGGTVNVKLGTTALPTHGANGTFTETGRATSTAFALTGAGLTDTVDNVSALPLTLSTLFASVVAATADVLALVNVTLESATSGKQAGLVLNLDSAVAPANFIIAYLDGNGNMKVDECVAGTYVNKISAAVTYSAAAPLMAERSSTELRAFYNNAAVGTVQTMTTNTNVKHGLFNTSPLSSLDVLQMWARGTSGEYATLDSY